MKELRRAFGVHRMLDVRCWMMDVSREPLHDDGDRTTAREDARPTGVTRRPAMIFHSRLRTLLRVANPPSGGVLAALMASAFLCWTGCGGDTHDHAHDHDHHHGHSAQNHHDHDEHHEEHDAQDHGHHGHEHHGGGSLGADFSEKDGIRLSAAARDTIGLQTDAVGWRELALEFSVAARVFHSAHQHGEEFPHHKEGHAYANAMIPSATANLLQTGQMAKIALPGVPGATFEGRLTSLDREAARAIGQVEAVIEIPDPEERIEFGAFVQARFAGRERTALVIPRGALVDAATGAFVYVQNGDRWRRVPVKTGAANDAFVEILDGVREGQVVVSQGAVDLWLIELRFTRGGGHAH